METILRLEITPGDACSEVLRDTVIRSDPIIKGVLATSRERPARLPEDKEFAVREDDRGVLQSLLKRLWAYSYVRGSLGYGIHPEHKYTAWEFNQAEYLLMRIDDWCGEFGSYHKTEYDKTHYCDACGAGAIVKGQLVCPPQRVKWIETGFGRLSDNEAVVTEDVLDVLLKGGIEGLEFSPIVGPRDRNRAPIAGVGHVRFTQECGPIPDRNVVNPSERCVNYGRESPHRPGFCLVSPLYLRRDQVHGDIFVTRDHFGQFMGHILPGPMIVVSQKVYRMFHSMGVTGVTFEPVVLIDDADDGLACGHEYDNLEDEAAGMGLL